MRFCRPDIRRRCNAEQLCLAKCMDNKIYSESFIENIHTGLDL